ncbi:MAG: LytTR family transcriptional regulator DNA-binding domain-containing protein [Lachnospiraceae bacterium]|nr:LytTR family transcriptional regulator DNA-binding domain-containing protein [Lachnospiraceae bacterium]
MKINIDVDSKYSDIGVDIHVPSLTPEVEKIISLMRMMDMQIAVKKGEETVLLDVGEILYIEAVERNTFIYTEKETYESALKLYEFEQQLSEKDFIRISKQSILNLRKVKSLRSDINRKIRVTLQNDEQIIVSRMYSDELRKRLGVK